MAPGPDPPLEIHVHVVNQPPRRAGPSLGVLVFALVCWPLVLLGVVVWFVVKLTLTAIGFVFLIVAGLVVAAGWLIGLAAPDAGGACMAFGRGIFTGTVHAVDTMNGHRMPSSRKPRA